MKLEIYEKPAVEVGSEDIRIQSILVGLENSGLTTERYDLFANPDEFESNETLKALMDQEGLDALPAFFVDDGLLHWGNYPENGAFLKWFDRGCGGGCCHSEKNGCCGKCGGSKDA